MPLTQADKVSVRRYLDYSAIGLYRQNNAGGTLAPMNTGFRMFNSYGNLEFKLNNLLPEEEATLTGRIYGSIGFNQPNPSQFVVDVDPGSTVTVSLSSAAFSASPVTINYTVTSTDTFLTICGNIANLFAQNGVFQAAGFYSMNGYGAGPLGFPSDPAQQVTQAIVSFVAPTPCTPFTIAVSGTGQSIPQIFNQGSPLPPTLTSNLSLPPTKIFGYLPILYYLEDQMVGSTSDNLSVFKANDAVLRLTEMRDRRQLFKNYCNRLATFLGILKNPDNPTLTGQATLGNVSGGNWSSI
jgi:hypothetical protein